MTAALFPDLIVNGEVVPHAAIAAETQNHTAPTDKPGIAWRKAANAMAIRTLLLQEARSRGIKPNPQEAGPGRVESNEEALIRGLLEDAIDVPPLSEAEVKAEWEKDPTRFRAPPLWEVSHILCACDPRNEAARDAMLKRAQRLLAEALRSPTSFPALAARESDCESKSSGGALGQLGPNDTVPEFEAALRTLTAGEISPTPILTRFGYHIIRLDAVAEGQVLPFETVRPKIALAMEKAAWARQSQHFINQLAQAAHIEGANLQKF